MWAALAVLAAGLLQALALADPWAGEPHGWLQIATLAVLAAVLQCHAHAAPRRAAVLAWIFGLAWLVGTFWWLFISMHTYGGLPAPLAAGAVFLLAAFLALVYAGAGAGFAFIQRCRPQQGPLTAALFFAAAWTLAELARGRWFTGFPWGAGGYAHTSGWLAGYAPWIGVYGIGFMAALAAAGWAALVLPPGAWGKSHTAKRNPKPASQRAGVLALVGLVPAVGLLLLGGYGVPKEQPAGPPVDVALLQGNIPQDEKFVPGTGVADALLWYGEQLLASDAALTVVPETAIPLLPAQLPEDYLQQLQQHFAQSDQLALLGIPLGSFSAGYTNSVIAAGMGAAPHYRYDKHHLVPFGEFIPPLFRWFTNLMRIPLGDFNRGPLVQASLAWQGERLAPNICYEDLFGEELAARFADADEAPTVLVNMSNIGWFGDTVAIAQHLQISRMRALEFARPMLRATNTGATAIIDHRGAVTAWLSPFSRAVLRGTFVGQRQITPYAFWASRLGLLPLWLGCLALLAGVALVSPPRRNTVSA